MIPESKASKVDAGLFAAKSYLMIPGSKASKSDASLLARGLLSLGPAKT